MTNAQHRITLLRRIALAACAGLLLGVAGCNTVHGFGEDVRSVGNSISNAAK